VNPDWDIVDDSDAQTPPDPTQANSRLDAERIRRIANERRAADRLRLWRVGIIITVILAAAIVIARVAYWLTR
jgi:hypothetical protein